MEWIKCLYHFFIIFKKKRKMTLYKPINCIKHYTCYPCPNMNISYHHFLFLSRGCPSCLFFHSSFHTCIQKGSQTIYGGCAVSVSPMFKIVTKIPTINATTINIFFTVKTHIDMDGLLLELAENTKILCSVCTKAT